MNLSKVKFRVIHEHYHCHQIKMQEALESCRIRPSTTKLRMSQVQCFSSLKIGELTFLIAEIKNVLSEFQNSSLQFIHNTHWTDQNVMSRPLIGQWILTKDKYFSLTTSSNPEHENNKLHPSPLFIYLFLTSGQYGTFVTLLWVTLRLQLMTILQSSTIEY